MRLLLVLLTVFFEAAVAHFPYDVEKTRVFSDAQPRPMPLTTVDYLKMKFSRQRPEVHNVRRLQDDNLVSFFGVDATSFDKLIDYLRYRGFYRAAEIADMTELSRIVEKANIDSFTATVPYDFAIEIWMDRMGDKADDITVLTDLAKSWIIPGVVLVPDQCEDDTIIPTLSKNVSLRVNVYGKEVKEVTLNGAHIFNGDKYSKDNQLVHISSVNYPIERQNAFDFLANKTYFRRFRRFIQRAGLEDYIKNTDPLTVFAPTNEAFDRVDSDTWQRLYEDKAFLQDVLKSHIIPKTIYSFGLAAPRNTFDTVKTGKSIDILNIDGNFVIADDPKLSYTAEIRVRDVTLTNGVLHFIDNVLIGPQ